MRIRRSLILLLVTGTAWTSGATPVSADRLFVANGNGNSVFEYALPSGKLPSPFVSIASGGLNNPRGLTFGPDGNLYVTGNITQPSGGFTGHVFRYNGTTGAFIDVFANTSDATPFGVKFGPDGNLYVVNLTDHSVSRFDGLTGAFIDDFVPGSTGGLSAPRDLLFGPDGKLYVASPGPLTGPGASLDQVRRYDGVTGAFIDVFASGVDARGLAFGPGGDLFVASFDTDTVLRFDSVTGASKGVFASGGGLDGPVGVLFGVDGNLYVSSFLNDRILRYNGSSGAFMDIFTSGNGLNAPRLMVSAAP
jgi:streptogramin lyase